MSLVLDAECVKENIRKKDMTIIKSKAGAYMLAAGSRGVLRGGDRRDGAASAAGGRFCIGVTNAVKDNKLHQGVAHNGVRKSRRTHSRHLQRHRGRVGGLQQQHGACWRRACGRRGNVRLRAHRPVAQ